MSAAEVEAIRPKVHGEYRFKIDAKGRVSMPSQFRKLFSDNLVVTVAPTESCLYVFEADGFDEWVAESFKRVYGEDYIGTDPAQRALHRALYRRARDIQPDTAGRIMLPPEQREQVGIGKDVVILGNGDHFEVWDEKRLDSDETEPDLSVLFG